MYTHFNVQYFMVFSFLRNNILRVSFHKLLIESIVTWFDLRMNGIHRNMSVLTSISCAFLTSTLHAIVSDSWIKATLWPAMLAKPEYTNSRVNMPKKLEKTVT